MAERIEVVLADQFDRVARVAVDLLAGLLGENPRARLGSATGGTMLPIYREVASRYAEGALSLKDAEVFQLDEYYPIEPWNPRSYRRFLKTHLVDVTDLPAARLFVPNGATSDPKATCERWEARLRQRPVDLQFVGLGVDGHIAFVESRPEGGRELGRSRTMLVDLAESTLRENARFFPADERPPSRGLTVGIGTLLDVVEHFVLVTSGAKKSAALARALLGDVDDRCPASYLREARGRITVLTDRAAAAELLARVDQPDSRARHVLLRNL